MHNIYNLVRASHLSAWNWPNHLPYVLISVRRTRIKRRNSVRNRYNRTEAVIRIMSQQTINHIQPSLIPQRLPDQIINIERHVSRFFAMRRRLPLTGQKKKKQLSRGEKTSHFLRCVHYYFIMFTKQIL